ncbi:M61 family metallopeptidase [Comamonas granuli]|uniref:M61 family metallopeptidase n=1 Tax=Comamonas granuli TaxID=290309 RepID=UPI0005A6EA23|nr:M61 family metallopeptidase [Comamonas granuli]
MPRPASAAPAAIHYRISAPHPHSHLFEVTLTIAAPAAGQELSLPVWIPGSYLVREFARHLQDLRARQGRKACAVTQIDKQRWSVACQGGKPLELRYAVHAHDASVRTAWLDAQRGFFNGTSLCLRVEGQHEQPCSVTLDAPELIAGSARWHCATALIPQNTDAWGFGTYGARDYDHLVDCPVEMGPFWSAHFSACGVPHRIVVSGAPASFDGERLVQDTRRICETAIRFWHGKGKPPFQRYLFLLHVVDEGFGGLEHGDSTALICGRRDLPRLGAGKVSDGYTTLLGLVSHEYFHAWNVKRLRPAALARYDYTQENYTPLLWFFEGFTSYYDDLLLRRAGLIDHAAYLKLLAKTINQVLQTPGRKVQTVAQASFDAWIRYYRPDANTPNITVSYYTKGALVALCLDLALRCQGRTTLDEVMRALWQRCSGGPMDETDLHAVLQALTGRSWDAELSAWVHSHTELPLAELLQAQGIALQTEAPQPAQRLGLRVQDGGPGGSLRIQTVLRGGLAEQAGMAPGDEWLGIEVQGQGWRITQLDDLALYAGPARKVTALVARDRRLLHLPLALQPQAALRAADTVTLAVTDAARASRWLDAL